MTATVDASLHRALLRLADAEGVSLFMVLHAALGALLSRWGAGEDVVIGTPVAYRSEPVLDDVIGLLTNTVVLRTDTSGDPAFRDLLARVRAFDVEALDHQDLPFERLVEELNPPRHPARHPLFQVMLALQNNERAVLRLGEDRVALRPTATGTAKFDLFVDVLERYGADHDPDGLDLHVEYATDLYEPHTAEEFARALRALLEAVCADPGVRIGALPATRAARPDADAGSALRAAELERTALAVRGVRDAVVLPATGEEPPTAYVVAHRAGAVEQVEQTFGGSAEAPRVNAVSDLPRTSDGLLDAEALRALPTVDRRAAEAWRRRVAGVPGVREADVRLEDVPRELERRHTGARARRPWRRRGRRGGGGAGRGGAGAQRGARPARAVGAGLGLRAHPRRAEPQGEIVHVRADGSETRRSYASLVEEASRVLAGLRRAGGCAPGTR